MAARRQTPPVPARFAEACGVEHPALIDAGSVEVLDGRPSPTELRKVYGYQPGLGPAQRHRQAEIARIMTSTEPQGSSAEPSAAAMPERGNRQAPHGDFRVDARVSFACRTSSGKKQRDKTAQLP
jgi:hypothetical protein